MAHKYQKPFIVDADFCRSYKNDGYNLAIIVATMKAMIHHGAWTFGMEYIKDNDSTECLELNYVYDNVNLGGKIDFKNKTITLLVNKN